MQRSGVFCSHLSACHAFPFGPRPFPAGVAAGHRWLAAGHVIPPTFAYRRRVVVGNLTSRPVLLAKASPDGR